MKIYGYTKVNSAGRHNGKESETFLFGSPKECNDAMYDDYQTTFETMGAEENFDTKDGRYVDENETTMASKDEFDKELAESEDIYHNIFGLIQCYEYHVQFEPFCNFNF